MSDLLVAVRDGWCCVRCGDQLAPWMEFSIHHRILGNRKDNRPSNLILLCGSGTTKCHLWVHQHGRDSRAAGWIVSRHGPREATLDIPVLYACPPNGRTPGEWLIDDGYGLLSEAA